MLGLLRTLCCLAAVLLAPAFASLAHAERRVALLLGNSTYKHAIRLPNAEADAEALAGVLRSLGFETVVGTDLTRDAMVQKLGEFAAIAGGADAALFFYAGHAIQLEGKNLLIPVDAELRSELDAKVRTIEIDSVLQHTIADAKVKIVLLDACRDNPFAKQIAAAAPRTRSVTVGSGLAAMQPGEGTLIAFATAAGQVAMDGEGKHSPFTRALLNHMPTPDAEIRQVLTLVRAQVAEDTNRRQLPWENTNMTGFFYMKRSVAAGAVQAPGPAAPQTAGNSGGFDPRALELELWNAVKSSSNQDDYKAYIEKYPAGTFADVARSRVAALSRGESAAAGQTVRSQVPQMPQGATAIATTEASEATENALGLDRDAWRDLQRRLTDLGFATRGTDGRIGNGTRSAITGWQQARGYPSTGYLNKLQHEALLRENVPATRSVSSGGNSSGVGGSGGDSEAATRRRGSSSGSRSTGDDAAAAAGAAIMGKVIQGVISKRLPGF